MLYQPVLRACWFILWQAGLKSYYRYISILSECWPVCHSDSHAIFYKDWSGASPNRTQVTPAQSSTSTRTCKSGPSSKTWPVGLFETLIACDFKNPYSARTILMNPQVSVSILYIYKIPVRSLGILENAPAAAKTQSNKILLVHRTASSKRVLPY